LDDLILVHNAGPTVPSYYSLKEARKNILFEEGNHGIFHAESIIDFLKKNKGLSNQCRVINFHNTCSSGTAAAVYAWKRIRLGLSRKVLVVGFEVSNNNFYTLTSLSSLGVMNIKGQSIQEAMIPFDCRRSGFVKADALAYLLIESENDRITPMAEIVSGAINSDSHSLTDGVENGEMVAATMSSCLEIANLSSDQVDYINAHGSGTYLNDLIELRGIKKIFGERKNLILSSTKSYFGHALCATGLVEISSVIGMFEHDFVAGNLNLSQSEEGFPYIIPPKPILNKKLKYVLKNSFGFGGYNSSILLKNVIIK